MFIILFCCLFLYYLFIHWNIFTIICFAFRLIYSISLFFQIAIQQLNIQQLIFVNPGMSFFWSLFEISLT